MSKQELYAWTSLAMSVALLGLYFTLVFGLPESVAAYGSGLKEVFWKVIGIAFVIELVLDLSKHTKAGRIDKDERDSLIEGKAFRNAYYVVMGAIIALAVHLFVSNLLTEASGEQIFLSAPLVALHALLVIFLVTGMTKSITQLYYYRRAI